MPQELRDAFRQAFPLYRGKRVYLSTCIPKRINSYWDEGSRDYWVFYQPSSGKMYEVNSNHPWFEADKPRELRRLPDDLILLRHSYSGTSQHVTCYMHAHMLPQWIAQT